MHWAVKDQVLHGLANPEVAYLIAMLGVLGIMLELFHPGTVVPGVVGGICLVIAAIAFQMLPVNIGALLLIALGIGRWCSTHGGGGRRRRWNDAGSSSDAWSH